MIKKTLLSACVLTLNFSGLFAAEQIEAPTVARSVKASCILHPTQGNKVEGVVTFTKVEDGVKIVAEVSNLTPGSHGFHIHEFGDCSAPDGSSAGGHFNPKKTQHGAPDAHERHAGDLGNLVADKQGNAHYERIDKVIELEGTDTIIGRSVVVHASEDDFKTQPTGNAGGRVACGVIEH